MQFEDRPWVVQPLYAPERNLAEYFFRELRRVWEGQVYPTLQAPKG